MTKSKGKKLRKLSKLKKQIIKIGKQKKGKYKNKQIIETKTFKDLTKKIKQQINTNRRT